MSRNAPILFLLLPAFLCAGDAVPTTRDIPPVATFSIVARDPLTGELGVAVQSKFIAVGAVVPWAKADVGAVATQAFANTTWGPAVLERLGHGERPGTIAEALSAADPDRARRQLGLVSASGEAATFTGGACFGWAGGVSGKNYAIQGNILANETVVPAMEKAFLESKGSLAERLLTALEAGQAAGGDVRGMQSAALLIVRKGWGYAGLNDRYRDLRVDDHASPIQELRRIHALHSALFPPPRP